MLGQHSVVRKQLCLGCLLPGGPGPQAVRPAGHMGALERCRRPPGGHLQVPARPGLLCCWDVKMCIPPA